MYLGSAKTTSRHLQTKAHWETKAGGPRKPEVVKVLCGNSGADDDWLVEKFNLDLSLHANHVAFFTLINGYCQPRRLDAGLEILAGITSSGRNEG